MEFLQFMVKVKLISLTSGIFRYLLEDVRFLFQLFVGIKVFPILRCSREVLLCLIQAN